MVHHIVMWKFKPEVEDAKKSELKKAMAENLKSLVGKVPGLLTVDFVEAPLASSTHDMALVTTLEKAEDVAVYAKHPEHVKVADTYVRPYTTERAALDYEDYGSVSEKPSTDFAGAFGLLRRPHSDKISHKLGLAAHEKPFSDTL